MKPSDRSIEMRKLNSCCRSTVPVVKNLLACCFALSLLGNGSAFASLAATATVTTSSTSAPYSYDITLHNTGTTNIGALWFAWTDAPTLYDFLPSLPTVTSKPTGWLAPISHNAIPGDGYGIEFYNLSGSALAPGASATFSFTTPDPPAIVGGDAFIPPNKVTTSFVYIGFPQSDPGFEFNAILVPEPSALVLAVVGPILLVLCYHRARNRACVARDCAARPATSSAPRATSQGNSLFEAT